MEVEILGTAAGGGFPQWNCACRNCDELRRNVFSGKPRTQLQVALTANGNSWYLLNASPDLRTQIENAPFLHPRSKARHSPIKGVVLTSGDLDQSLGLLLLREFQPLQIFATNSIRNILLEDNSIFLMLHRTTDQARWNQIVPGVEFQLRFPNDGQPIECIPVPLQTRYPAYVTADRATELAPNEAVLGLILRAQSGRQFGYFPVVGAIDGNLLRHLSSLDVLLFDGTFWSDDELSKVKSGAKTARQMGHIPISSSEGSVALLSDLQCSRKMFVHINNTNPILDISGPEYKQVLEAGWEIPEDGCHLEL